MAFVAQGAVSDYGAEQRQALAARMAALAGVAISEVEITVEAASVRVTALIAAPSAAAATALSAPLSAALADPHAASQTLGINVTSPPTVTTLEVRRVVAPPQAPPLLSPPPPSPPPPPPLASPGLLSPLASIQEEGATAALSTNQDGKVEEPPFALPLPMGAVVAYAVGAVCFAAALAVLLACRRRRRAKLGTVRLRKAPRPPGKQEASSSSSAPTHAHPPHLQRSDHTAAELEPAWDLSPPTSPIVAPVASTLVTNDLSLEQVRTRPPPLPLYPSTPLTLCPSPALILPSSPPLLGVP